MITAISYRTPAALNVLPLLRTLLLALALVAAVVAVVVAVNLAWPVIVAIAGKALAGGAGTAAFAFVFKPKGV